MIDKHKIRVIHPNITGLEIAQTIQVSRKKIINARGNTFLVLSSPSVIFDNNTPGQAVLYFRDWYIQDTLTNEKGLIAEQDIIALEIEVALPRYSQATEDISKFATLIMKGK